MVKIVVKVEGMACGMCEAHVSDTVRGAFAVKRVTSSHKKGETEIIAEQPLDENAIKSAIEATGYSVTGIETLPYEKKGFWIFGKN